MALGLSLIQVSNTARPALPTQSACSKRACKLKTLSHLVVNDDVKGNLRGSIMLLSNVSMNDWYQGLRHYASQSGIKHSVISQQWSEWKRVTPAQLLPVVQEVLIEDEVYLNFDLHQFFSRCLEFLGSVAISYFHHIGPDKAKRALQRTTRMYEVVHEVLLDATVVETRQLDPSTTVLYNAGQLVSQMSRNERALSIDEALSMSSGHLMDCLKPSARFGPWAVARIEELRPKTCLIEVNQLSMFRVHGETPPQSLLYYNQDEVEEIAATVENEAHGWTALGFNKAARTERMRCEINKCMYQAKIPMRVMQVEEEGEN
ncbi:hypothetical protein Slin15195_G073670 [Septoria linicola]|uniref:Uncharacterized protein n=1 Tax=Septoria linicola TaxID=215465 RepID=A0A9Q9EM35_9PEZI|nr:hypothetical protein Slin15195_G073670 [Septoria linicola]